jgi:hypothetical protein
MFHPIVTQKADNYRINDLATVLFTHKVLIGSVYVIYVCDTRKYKLIVRQIIPVYYYFFWSAGVLLQLCKVANRKSGHLYRVMQKDCGISLLPVKAPAMPFCVIITQQFLRRIILYANLAKLILHCGGLLKINCCSIIVSSEIEPLVKVLCYFDIQCN